MPATAVSGLTLAVMSVEIGDNINKIIMYIVTYLKHTPILKKVLGVILMLLGLFMLITSNIIFGAIFFAIGLNLNVTEGSQIDLMSKTYRKIHSLFGLHYGKWQPCPEFDYVSVFRTRESQTIRVVTAEARVESEIILLNLFYENKNMTFYKTNDKKDAFAVAERFKDILGIDILDATEREKKWLT